MDANEEFRGLFERSGWTQAECARQLDLTPQDVSRYLGGVHPPDKQTLRLFKIILSSDNPEALAPSGMVLRETPPDHTELLQEAHTTLEKLRAALSGKKPVTYSRKKTEKPSSGAGEKNDHFLERVAENLSSGTVKPRKPRGPGKKRGKAIRPSSGNQTSAHQPSSGERPGLK